ncbi:MAG TPA: sugar transferase [Anaerolineae bacterium]|nr:sugar transferase [Anaerolineae bacterium]
MNSRPISKRIKRAADVLLSGVALTASLPLWLATAILVKVESKGPVFFVQKRVGKDGKPFSAYKFRTMVQGAADKGAGLFIEGQDDPRITRAGRFLRRWSLDELPQFINILRGEMSVVGPRPTLLYQVEQYDQFQRRRLEVKPGITGWAQIHGRNVLSWPERIEYDVWYVDNWNIALDVEIILRTFRVLFQREGLYAGKEKFLIRPQDEEPR